MDDLLWRSSGDCRDEADRETRKVRRLASAFAVVKLDSDDRVGSQTHGLAAQRIERGVVVAHLLVDVDDTHDLGGSIEVCRLEDQHPICWTTKDGGRRHGLVMRSEVRRDGGVVDSHGGSRRHLDASSGRDDDRRDEDESTHAKTSSNEGSGAPSRRRPAFDSALVIANSVPSASPAHAQGRESWFAPKAARTAAKGLS
jgi:hypothetical protein